ncbi:transmembrane protein 104 homolog [Scaptodrosophila lebanonensis]|uniref:Transmembrane protein 104 homolog n=1 Tax=Drosophila lebanonensis TaxID=7225 RepID=A0A6J2TTZ7_DROLE|nr:transmembrane protein 104 homolog [Scaptodrosophila lebanonensis]
MPRQGEVDFVDAPVASYSNWVGFVFIFNLIVGTGALTLPGVFARAGWLLSLLIIILLAVISYITVTYVIESMACANAVRNWQNLQALRISRNDDVNDDEVDAPLLPAASLQDQIVGGGDELERVPLTIQNAEFHYYQLNHKFELGEMASLFFNDFGRIVFYMCFIIYLYGDLSIYSAAVARSLRDVVCDHTNNTNVSQSNMLYWPADFKHNAIDACWEDHTISRLSMYRVFLIGFVMIFGPFTAFSVQKTKYLQMATAAFRWLAFTLMICLALKLLITNGPKGHPVSVNVYGIPSLFGACVYSFMCHHSLPSLLAPLKHKLKAVKILSYDYIVICTFYIVLAMTGIFAFEHIEDLYTLNFLPSKVDYSNFFSVLLYGIDYFLALFPVFTLSTSFPIVAITLRNNLQALFLDTIHYDSYNFFVRRILFPLCTIVPPFCITYFTESLANLVAFTGSYAGAGIQYVIPVCLVYFSRRTCIELLGSGLKNQFESPFKSNIWLALVLLWSIACVCLVSINLFS